ncbi:MAG: glutamine synthetase family protein [Dehalococcoidia bacterium]
MVTTDPEANRYVLHTAREQDVRFIRLWFTDILGGLKGFTLTVDELEEVLEEGRGFDGSTIKGFARTDERDMIALPDPTTFRILPWRPQKVSVARMFCDILTPDGEPFPGDSRDVLQRNLQRATDMGYTYYVRPEMEFFYFRGPEDTQVLDQSGYFDMAPIDLPTELRRETVLVLEEMGIGVDSSHHEAATSQHEIVLRYTDALTMADSVMTFRLVVKEVALKHDVYATFMPKPIYGVNGSGMHIDQALFQGERNIFYDAEEEFHISQEARYFIAGLMRHAPEITVVTNQWVNSYKRLIPGYEAPVYVSWARTNRADLIRIPEWETGRESFTRIEYRSPDPACNPYLAFSVMLAAGLEGMENRYPLPDPVEVNVAEMDPEERRDRDIKTLPGSLWEAITIAEDSDMLRRSLGEHVFNSFLENKKIEWDSYRSQVTDYELKRYLPVL